MNSSVVAFVILFILACWVLVIGHQMGYHAFDPSVYSVLEGALIIAYTVAAISLCGVAAFLFLSMVVKR